MKNIAITAAFAGALALGGAGSAQAWEPTKPIEFVVTSGAGGGTDNFARIIQSIITKHKFTEQRIVVVNKGGGSGAEGYVSKPISVLKFVEAVRTLLAAAAARAEEAPADQAAEAAEVPETQEAAAPEGEAAPEEATVEGETPEEDPPQASP